MGNIKLLEELFDKKILQVIKFFLSNKDKEFYLQEIANHVHVPIATVFRIIKKLKTLGLVQEIRIKKFKLYRCSKNDNVEFLEGFMKEGRRILDNFVQMAAQMPSVEQIILHGKEQEDKANILLIGRSIDHNAVKRLCAAIKEQYHFTVTALSLEQVQYEQMSAMGLYAGSKRSLFKR
ncbi:hypothetical protein GOV09_05940 [Candidatus Woesearchaeota archaeon]|nr:hypothetical protein [Candidatus Woesearchaeota archaeon]